MSTTIDDLRARIAELEAALEWQPIETAPKGGLRVLLWSRQWSAQQTGQWYGVHGWAPIYGAPFVHQPTHWRPLDPPPGRLWLGLNETASDVVLVPVEPTAEMIEAGAEYCARRELGDHPYADEKRFRMGVWCHRVPEIYRAMIQARAKA